MWKFLKSLFLRTPTLEVGQIYIQDPKDSFTAPKMVIKAIVGDYVQYAQLNKKDGTESSYKRSIQIPTFLLLYKPIP